MRFQTTTDRKAEGSTTPLHGGPIPRSRQTGKRQRRQPVGESGPWRQFGSAVHWAISDVAVYGATAYRPDDSSLFLRTRVSDDHVGDHPRNGWMRFVGAQSDKSAGARQKSDWGGDVLRIL